MDPILATRLEKSAVDNGFDLERPSDGLWLGFASSQCSLELWLGVSATGGLVAAFSRDSVLRALDDYGTLVPATLPPGAVGGRETKDIPALHRLLRRAFQLGRSLPDELLHVFQARTAGLPRSTEAERLIVQRVGQDIFRHGLLEYWEGRCAITGLAVPELLRASHIKPWADCETDAERLDVFNGLLLAPQLDAAFDCGLITLANDGTVLVSERLAAKDRTLLGWHDLSPLLGLTDRHRSYLAWHREKVFRRRSFELLT